MDRKREHRYGTCNAGQAWKAIKLASVMRIHCHSSAEGQINAVQSLQVALPSCWSLYVFICLIAESHRQLGLKRGLMRPF